jgi:hypothetical protein
MDWALEPIVTSEIETIGTGNLMQLFNFLDAASQRSDRIQHKHSDRQPNDDREDELSNIYLQHGLDPLLESCVRHNHASTEPIMT